MARSDFIRLLRTIIRRRWLVTAVGLTTLVVVILGALLMPLYYRASTMVMPSNAAQRDPLVMRPGGMADSYKMDKSQETATLTIFVGLAKSPEVMKKAQQDLGLNMTPEQLAQSVIFEPTYAAAFNIIALARTPDEAVRISNGFAQALREYYSTESAAEVLRQRKGLEERVLKLQDKMRQAKDDIEQLRDQDVTLPSADTQNNPLLSRQASLQMDLDNALTQMSQVAETRRRTEQELARQPARITNETSTTETPMVGALKGELSRLEQDLLNAKSRYTDKHRDVIRINSQISQVKARLANTIGQMDTAKVLSPNPLRSALQSSLVQAKIDEASVSTRIAAIQKLIESNQNKMRASSDKSIVLAARMADYQAASEAYRQMSGVYQAASVEQQSEGGMPEIQVVQPATFAEGPAPRKGPTRIQLIILGAVLSIVLGVGAAIVAETLDVSLKSVDEVQAVLQLPLSASIPQVVGEERKSLPQITRALPISPYAESYRFLRTSILSDGLGESVRSLMLTAASPGQGSTTTIANLALSLAEAGRRVVLVDCDLRRPRQHKVFGVDNSVGLSDVVLADMEIDKALQYTGVDGLYLLPAGPASDNPSALLNSAKMRRVLQQLEERFEHVLVDTPPVLAFSDSITLATLLDGVILTVRVGDASRGNEVQAKAILEKAGARILGVVVNGLSASQMDSFHYHSHYYGHTALPATVENYNNNEAVQ